MPTRRSTKPAGGESTRPTKGPGAAADLARLRQGELNLHPSVAYAFLPDAEVDALLSRLAAAPARPAELAADHPGAGRRLLLTLLWLRKFNLVEFRRAATRTIT